MLVGRIVSLFWVACCMFFASFQYVGAADGEINLAAHFSEDTIFYVAEEDFSEDLKDWKETSLGKIWLEPEVQDFFSRPEMRINQALAMADGFLEANQSQLKVADIFSLINKRFAFGVKFSPEDKVFSFKLVSGLQSNDAAKKLLEKLVSELKKNTPPQLQSNWSLDTAKTVIIRQNNFFLTLKSQGDLLLVGGSNIEADAVGILGISNEKSLLTASVYKNAVAGMGGDCRNITFVNLEKIWSLIDKNSAGDPKLVQAMAVMKALGITDVNSLASNMKIEKPGFTQQSWVGTASPVSGLLSLIKAGKVNGKLLNCVPADAAAFSTYKIDLGKFFEVVRNAAGVAGMDAANADGMLQMAAMQIGINPEAELFNCLGDELILISLNPDSVGGLPFFGLNSTAAVFKVKDTEKLNGALTKAFAKGGDALAKSKVGGGALHKDHNGITVNGIRIANIITPSIAMVDNFLVVAAGPQGASLIVDAIQGKVKRITADPDFKKVFPGVEGEQGFMLSYSRKSKFSLASGGGLSSISGASILAGMLLPALQKARSAAEKTKCMNNLKQMGTAMALYRSDTYYGKQPEKLQDLYKNGDGIIGDINLFTCPEGKGGYTYIGGKAAGVVGPSCMIVWDARPHSDNSRCALYRDGHCKLLKDHQFNEELNEIKAFLNEKQIAFNPQQPFNAGMAGAKPKNPFEKMLQNFSLGMTGQEEQILKTILDTFQMYKLPSANSINRHLFSESGKGKVTENGLLISAHGPLPFSTGTNAQSIVNPAGVSTVAIVAAIAIPNLLESKKAANESNGAVSLKTAFTAQMTYHANNYSVINGAKKKMFAKSFRFLGGANAHKDDAGNPIRLIPDPLAEAVSPDKAFNGYYFVDIPLCITGDKFNHVFDFGLCAVPAVYGKTGTNTFAIDAKGTVLMKDNGGKPVKQMPVAGQDGWIAW